QKQRKLDLGVLTRLRAHIRAWRPDIVHGFLYDGDIYSRLAAWGCRVPVLNSERNDNYALSFLQRIGYRLTSMLCDGIVANSHAGAAFARRVHRRQQNDVHVVWNGIDLQEIDARTARSGQPAREIAPGPGVKRLCLVGAIKPQKDYLLALRAMRGWVSEAGSGRLICVGEQLALKPSGYKREVLAERERLQL